MIHAIENLAQWGLIRTGLERRQTHRAWVKPRAGNPRNDASKRYFDWASNVAMREAAIRREPHRPAPLLRPQPEQQQNAAFEVYRD